MTEIMASFRKDPTANAAIGSIDKELKLREQEAERLAVRRAQGRLSSTEEAAARKRFTGIYRSVLNRAFAKAEEMQDEALYLAYLQDEGLLSPDEKEEARKRFVGPYRCLLDRALAV